MKRNEEEMRAGKGRELKDTALLGILTENYVHTNLYILIYVARAFYRS